MQLVLDQLSVSEYHELLLERGTLFLRVDEFLQRVLLVVHFVEQELGEVDFECVALGELLDAVLVVVLALRDEQRVALEVGDLVLAGDARVHGLVLAELPVQLLLVLHHLLLEVPQRTVLEHAELAVVVHIPLQRHLRISALVYFGLTYLSYLSSLSASGSM